MKKLNILLMNVASVTFIPHSSVIGGTATFTVETQDGNLFKQSTWHGLDQHKLERDYPAIQTALLAKVSSIIHLPNAKKIREFADQMTFEIFERIFVGYKGTQHGLLSIRFENVKPFLATAMVSSICRVTGAHKQRGVVESSIHPHGYHVDVVRGMARVHHREPVYPETSTKRGDCAPERYELVELAA